MGTGLLISVYVGWQLMMPPKWLRLGLTANGDQGLSQGRIFPALTGAVSAGALYAIAGAQLADYGTAVTIVSAIAAGALGAACAHGVRRLGVTTGNQPGG